MKKCTFLFLFFSLAVTAQVFPDYDLSLVVGHKVKPIEGNYVKQNGYKQYLATERIFGYKYGINNPGKTPYEKLSGRVFEVVSYTTNEGTTESVIKLKDISTEEVLYYNHNWGSPSYDDEIEIAEEIELPSDYFCNYIESGHNEKPGEYYKSVNGGRSVELTKWTINGKTSYKLYTYTLAQDSRPKVAKGTVTLNLSNDKKIFRNNIAVKSEVVNPLTTKYEVTFEITQAELELIKNNKVLSNNILTADQRILNIEESGILTGSVDCLMKK